MRKMINKRGVSPIIATVLLLLITVIAASLISVFIIPFVKQNLQEGQQCFDILGDLAFYESQYNCYITNITVGYRTGFSVRIDNDAIKGFKVALYQAGTSNSYEILNGTQVSGIEMLNNGVSVPILQTPKKGGVRTYVASGRYERVDIFPILETGELCGQSDSINLAPCLDMQANTELAN